MLHLSTPYPRNSICYGKGYGGEIFCWDLCCGLAELNVEVHLFAIPGSVPPPNGYLHYVPKGTWEDFMHMEQYPIRYYRRVLLDMDVIHDMTHSHFTHDYFAYRLGKKNVVSTPWGTLIAWPFYRERLVVWSRFHREVALQQGWPASTKYVLGGCNVDFYCPSSVKPFEKDDYVLWFARMHPTKRPDIVYELAEHFPNQPFIVAGSMSWSPDHAYYGARYKEAFERLSNVKFIGDVTHEEKRELFRGAKALIFPSVGEAFGLVLVEALACACPVIASNDGAFPELIVEGKTGFLANTTEEYQRALTNLDTLSPEACREDAVKRFSRSRVAQEYLEIYIDVAKNIVW